MTSLADDLLGGKYRLGPVLATGGMGTVFRATHVELDRAVAVKVLRGELIEDPSIVERFRLEARTVARLRHPYLVTIYDFGVDEALGAYLVMELLEGRSLAKEIRAHGPLEIAFAVDVMRRVCLGVQAAHEAGVIHRDLKPDNIFLEVTSRGTIPRVLDFGIVKIVGGADADPRMTVHGRVLGTPTYMSPEQCQGKAIDARSDVYALGCVLFEMLTGRAPVGAGSVAAQLTAHVTQAAEAPSRLARGIPAALDDAVLRALAKEPALRFPTARAFHDALSAVELVADPQRAAGDDPALDATQAPDQLPSTHEITPARLSARVRGNLPHPISSFVGRSREIDEVSELFHGARLVTLTGIGGIGKTRLALHVGRILEDRHADGVWLVELAALDDPSLVADAVARALGLPGQAGPPPHDSLSDFLRTKQALLILDNCEHLLSACASLTEALLLDAPRLRVLATSRAALGIAGETSWPVPTLSLASRLAGDAPEAVLSSEAVRLFVDRASQARPGFRLTPELAPTVREIVSQLDGIPLAIELAAARVKVLSPEQILAKLDDRFRLLESGPRSALRRQQALRATFDWSHQLLSPAEQRLFARLSVFAGGFSLEAAEAICGPLDPDGGEDVLELLTQLVEKSLVMVDTEGTETRFGMLETTRSYAAEKLAASGEAERLAVAHRDWFLGLAERLTERAGSRLSDPACVRLALEHGNLRAALHWSLKRPGDAQPALRLCAALGPFWYLRTHWTEGRRALEAALARGTDLDANLCGEALHWAGILAEEQGDFEHARELLDDSLALRRLGDDERALATTLQALAHVAERMGDYDVATELKRECIERMRRTDDPRGLLRAINGLGLRALFRGAYDEAVELLEEALAISRRIEDLPNVGVILHNLGEAELRRGRLERAESRLAESIELARTMDARRIVAYSSNLLGALATLRGDVAAARRHFHAALVFVRDEGDKDGLAYAFEGLAGVEILAGDPASAMRLAGAAVGLRTAIRSTLSPPEQQAFDGVLDGLREALGADVAARCFDEGRGLSLADAIGHALDASTHDASA
ncbi:MAG: protein kinase [bacterium]